MKTFTDAQARYYARKRGWKAYKKRCTCWVHIEDGQAYMNRGRYRLIDEHGSIIGGLDFDLFPEEAVLLCQRSCRKP